MKSLVFSVYVHAQSLSHVRLFETLWTVAHQAPLSLGFSRQEYWSGGSLEVQGLRLQVAMHGPLGSIPGQRTRSHMMQLLYSAVKIEDQTWHNQTSKNEFFKK